MAKKSSNPRQSASSNVFTWPGRTWHWLVTRLVSRLADLKWPAATLAFPGVTDFAGDAPTDTDY